MELLHFDKDRYIAFISDKGKNFFSTPPFDNVSRLRKNLDFPSPAISFSRKNDLFEHIKNEFAVSNVSNMMEIWHKYNSSSVATMTPDKIRNQMIKYMNREFGEGDFNDVSLRDYHTFQLAFGFSKDKLALPLRNAELIDETKAKNIRSRLTQESGMWKRDVDKLVSYVEAVLMKEGRIEEADKVLSLIKLNPEGVSSQSIEKIDGLMNTTKAAIRNKSIENGESLAKPWQKYINPEPNYHFASPGEKKKRKDDS